MAKLSKTFRITYISVTLRLRDDKGSRYVGAEGSVSGHFGCYTEETQNARPMTTHTSIQQIR